MSHSVISRQIAGRGPSSDEYSPTPPPAKGGLAGKVVTVLVSLVVGAGGAHLWNNGLEDDFCGALGRYVPAACPQEKDWVDDPAALAYAQKLTTATDANYTSDEVYDRLLVTAKGKTEQDEKERFSEIIGRIDHMEYLGNLKRDRGNRFTFDAMVWTTLPQYPFDKRWKPRRNTEAQYKVTIELINGGLEIRGLVPTLDKEEDHYTHPSPGFTFIKNGYYFDDADSVTPRVTHPVGPDKNQAATCYWVPSKAIQDGSITDVTQLMLRTYVGWVHYTETSLSSPGEPWPEGFAPCSTPQ